MSKLNASRFHSSRGGVRRLVWVLMSAGMAFASGVSAQELDLTRVPATLSAAVPPNLMMTLDDSGSMTLGFTPDSLAFTSTGGNVGCYWRFPRYYSPQINRQYYDPNQVYTPPVRADGTSFPAANATSPRIDGFIGTATRNIVTNYAAHTIGDVYGGTRQWITHSGTLNSTTTAPMGPTNCGGNWQTQNKSARFPFGATAFYYDYQPNATYSNGSPNDARNFVAVEVTGTAQRQNFANWFQYYRTRVLTAKTSLSLTFGDVDGGNRLIWQNYHRTSLTDGDRHPGGEIHSLDHEIGGTTWKHRFYDWLQLAEVPGLGTPMRQALVDGNEFFAGGSPTQLNASNPYWEPVTNQELSCRQNFHVFITDGYWNGVNPTTPAIGNYQGTSTSFPDGQEYSPGGAAERVFSNQPDPTANYCNPNNNNVPQAQCLPRMSDIAMYYWGSDLRDDLDDNVPPYIPDQRTGRVTGASVEDEVYFNPLNNPATWQHVVNYIIGFSVAGTLPYSRESDCVNDATQNVPNLCEGARLLRLRQGLDSWPEIRAGQANTVDDAWHAAINSRGRFFTADSSQDLINALSSVLDNINRRRGVTAASASSAFFRAGEFDYTALYDSSSWSGDVEAVDGDGENAWSAGTAAEQLAARPFGGRNIFTWQPGAGGPGTGAQRQFEWAQLSALQREWLSFDPATGLNDTRGAQRVDFLRGNRAGEQLNGGEFRNRGSVLGAVVGSNLAYVEAPAGGYVARPGFAEGGVPYGDFRSDHRNRTPMLYVGANDGMLHAFNARTGREEWAFVPNQVIANLSRLTTPAFQFVPTVDGKISIHDVYVNGAWRTYLFGTLGLGGQAVYAIDITDPLAPRVRWELSDTHEPHLGYNYGAATVARIQVSATDFRWVALVPSGYNHSATVDYATRGLPYARSDNSHHDDAALLVVDVTTGQVLHRLSGFPGTGSALGLAQTTPGEYGRIYVAEFAVAGDLNGNLWKFDLTPARIGSIQHVFRGSPDRPITSAPRVFRDSGRGVVFGFGTGKLLEEEDRLNPQSIPQQALYGVYDCRPDRATCVVATDDDLVRQTFVQSAQDGYIAMNETLVIPPQARGWYHLLGAPGLLGGNLRGERVLDTPEAIFVANAFVVRSFIPGNDPCSPIGEHVDYILNASTGGFLFPGALVDGAYLPGTSVFGPPSGPEDVGIYRPGLGGGGPGPGPGSGIGDLSMSIMPNGCLLIGGQVTNICINPRRRGWSELTDE